MLDFSELLKSESKDSPSSIGVQSGVSSLQFYRSEEVKMLVEETFRFDGHPVPISYPYKFNDIPSQVEEHSAQLLVIDLIGCPDTLKECKQLSARLPASLSVVILGDVDAISVIRELKALGFYYLFWPVEKIELAEFIDTVVTRHIAASSLSGRRRAKRIGLIGMRGGVGATLLTAELSWILSNDKQTSCLVVDNNYLSSNLDIYLGIKNREKRRINDTETGGEIDQASAKTLVTRVNNRLDYLALGLSNESSVDLHEMNELVVNYLAPDTNFILDDLSASVGFDIQPKTFLKTLDVAVLVMEPTISCLRETAAMLSKIKKLLEEPDYNRNVRILLVLNNHRASRFNSVTLAEVEKYLDIGIDFVLPYEISVEETLLNGTFLSTQKSKLGDQIKRLCSRIIGEEVIKKRKIFSFSLLGGK
ncbi:AAA family ATPase [Enterovibrio norvegicus]|uniref:Type II secretion protein ATPase n=1 Tax=Enterovibrio norvegicus TaxID=188144 RepID=A0A2N7L812_9GAMM|nr:type II secretion protein ATPase [Enterovibrio norvegicus]PMN71905.1 type II secretion protein ATPase [Enterovibrio norvegicus]PMN90263.1 type II secretion protein ATPase [Enterovibrio norvegicus]